MRSPAQIETDFTELASRSSLASAIGGKVYRSGGRPLGSKEEDVVVRHLSGTLGQIQEGVVLLRAYVPNLRLSDGRDYPDYARLSELEGALVSFVQEQGKGFYRMEAVEAATAEDIEFAGQTAASLEIKYKFLNA